MIHRRQLLRATFGSTWRCQASPTWWAAQIAAMVTPSGDFISNHRAGKLRILATSGAKRSPFIPDVPTFAEQGFPDFVVEEWFGFYAPARTPAAPHASPQLLL